MGEIAARPDVAEATEVAWAAGADAVTVDGAEGGSGWAPTGFLDQVGLPLAECLRRIGSPVGCLLAGGRCWRRYPVQDGEQVVVTVDAAHTQRETAEYLKGERGFDYIMTVKGNQPNLLKAVVDRCRPLLHNTPDHVVEEYNHGQLHRWETWITDATGIDFPHIAQAACIRRTTLGPTGNCIRKEHAWPITSGPAPTLTAADLHTHVRGHWGIENKSHYPRDVTWREDAQ